MCFRPEKTVSVEKHHAKLEEGGVKLDLTVVRISTPVFLIQINTDSITQIDTPGFGDVVNNSNCWQSIAGELKIKQIS